MYIKNYTYRSLIIRKTVFNRYEVTAKPYGDGTGEDKYTFPTLGKAKDFIDRMSAEWGLV